MTDWAKPADKVGRSARTLLRWLKNQVRKGRITIS